MYVERSSRGYPKKDKLIDELNFKQFVDLKGETTSKFFVGITHKKNLSIQNILMPTISSYVFLF